MSAGNFVDGKYETDLGIVIPCRNQPETNAAVIGGVTNTAPSGNVVPGYPDAKVGGSRRAFGIHTRTVSIKFTGTAPSGYQTGDIIRLPVFQKSTWDGIVKRQTVSYLAGTAIVVSKAPEVIR